MGGQKKLVSLSFGIKNREQFAQGAWMKEGIGLVDCDHLGFARSQDNVKHRDHIADAGAHAGQGSREVSPAFLLVARAQAERVSVSVLVRGAVAQELGLDKAVTDRQAISLGAPSSGASVKLSIRMTPEEAEQLAADARAAGLSRGAYLSGLIANVPVLTSGANRTDHIATLVASSAELSTLSRNIHHLTSLLREGNVRPALAYRDMLDTLAGDVRSHLTLAASVLADLRPRIRSSDASTHPTT